MAQYARPDADITRTNVASGTYADIDETTPSDSDYLYGTNNSNVTYECGLSNVSDPNSSSGHTFRYRVVKTYTGTPDAGGSTTYVTAYLYQGTTLIATDTERTLDGTWTTYSMTISSSEADSITNYTDLRLRIYSGASGGSVANRRSVGLSWAELEVPDVSSGSAEETANAAIYKAATASATINSVDSGISLGNTWSAATTGYIVVEEELYDPA
jgi:hypothetical protein